MIIFVVNKWLWNNQFFWINYSITIILAVAWLVIRFGGLTSRILLVFPLLSPVIAYSLYMLFDRIIQQRYGRHFIIVGRGMSRYKWKYKNVDIIFSLVMVLASLLLPFLLEMLLH